MAILLAGLLGGCGETVLTQWPQERIFQVYFRLQEVKPGMNRAEVEAIMGPPQVQEEGDFLGGRFLFLFYRTHNMDYEGSSTVRGGFTPLILQGDRLVGLGRRDYFRATDRPWLGDAPQQESGPQGLPSPWQRSW
jgi:hypothetical protein